MRTLVLFVTVVLIAALKAAAEEADCRENTIRRKVDTKLGRKVNLDLMQEDETIKTYYNYYGASGTPFGASEVRLVVRKVSTGTPPNVNGPPPNGYNSQYSLLLSTAESVTSYHAVVYFDQEFLFFGEKIHFQHYLYIDSNSTCHATVDALDLDNFTVQEVLSNTGSHVAPSP